MAYDPQPALPLVDGRCQLCGTTVEMQLGDGRTMLFVPHRDDPNFCAWSTLDRIQSLTRMVRGAAEDNALMGADAARRAFSLRARHEEKLDEIYQKLRTAEAQLRSDPRFSAATGLR